MSWMLSSLYSLVILNLCYFISLSSNFRTTKKGFLFGRMYFAVGAVLNAVRVARHQFTAPVYQEAFES